MELKQNENNMDDSFSCKYFRVSLNNRKPDFSCTYPYPPYHSKTPVICGADVGNCPYVLAVKNKLNKQ